MTDLNGKVVLVTGSSRGIGAEIAVAFARQGAKVVLHGRDTEALAKVHADITNGGGQAMFVTGDVTKFADIEAIRARVEQAYGLVDVLVACAGGSGSRPGPIEDIGEESWRADLDANLTATFLTIKSFLPGMKRRGSGSIITMSSAAGRRASAHTLVAYGAAKAGVQLLTQDLAAQVGPHGIRANCIAPGTILTERTRPGSPNSSSRNWSNPTRCGGSAPRRTSHGPPCTSPQMRQAGSPVWSSTSAAVLSWCDALTAKRRHQTLIIAWPGSVRGPTNGLAQLRPQ